MNNDTRNGTGPLYTLLDLDGEIFMLDGGYWVKIEVNPVSPSTSIPHGIRYSLTLHDKNNVRVIGFDNAHAVKSKSRRKFSGRKLTWDHKHHMDKATSYEFESAGQPLDDFWRTVDEYLGE